MAEPISFQEMVDKYADRREDAEKEPLFDVGIQNYLRKNGLHLKTAMQFPEDSFTGSLMEGLGDHNKMLWFRNYLRDKCNVPYIEGSPEDYEKLADKTPVELRSRLAKNLGMFRGFAPSFMNHFPPNAITFMWNRDGGGEGNGFGHLSHLMQDPDMRSQIINLIRKRAEKDDSHLIWHVMDLAKAAKGKITPDELEELSGIMSKNLGSENGLGEAAYMADERGVPEMLHAYLNHGGLDTSLPASYWGGKKAYEKRNDHNLHSVILDYVRNGKFKDESRRKFAIEYALSRGAAPKMTDAEFKEALGLQAQNQSHMMTEPLINFIHDDALSEEKVKAANDIYRKQVRNPDQQHEWSAAISKLPVIPVSKDAVHSVLENRYGRVGMKDRTNPTSLGYFLKPEEVDGLVDDAPRNYSLNYKHNLANMLIGRKVHNAYGQDLTPKQQEFLDKTIQELDPDEPALANYAKQRAEFFVSEQLRRSGLGKGYIQTPQDLTNRLEALNTQYVGLPEVMNHPMADHDALARLNQMASKDGFNMGNKEQELDRRYYHDSDRLKRLFPNEDTEKSLLNGLYGKLTHVKVGSASLRKLRDYLQEKGVQIRPEELPKPEKGVSWNSIVKEIRDRHGNVNYAQDWNPLRASNGKLSHEMVASYIDNMPTKAFSVADDRAWNHALQNHSSDPTNIMSVNLAPDMAQKLKDSDLWDEFVDLALGDAHRAHPTSNHTIGWTRYSIDHNDKSIFIDECQSDLLGNYRNRMAASDVPDKKKAKYKKVWDMVFGKDHPSEVISETAHQHFRDGDLHDYTIATHTVDSKRGISIKEDPDKPAPAHMNETYKNVPKKMGMESGKYGDRVTETGDGDYDLIGKPVHVGKIRKSEDPNETFPEFMREFMKQNPHMVRESPESGLRSAVTRYLIDHKNEGREITLKDYEHVLKEYEEPIEEYRKEMDYDKDFMERKLLRSMAVPSDWAMEDHPQIYGSSELIHKMLDNIAAKKLSTVDVRKLAFHARLTPELIEKVLDLGEMDKRDHHNVLLQHRDLKGVENLDKYKSVIDALQRRKPFADVLKDAGKDEDLKDAQRTWTEVVGDLRNRENEATSNADKAKYRSIMDGIRGNIDYSDRFFSDPNIPYGYADEIREQLIGMANKAQLNKYIDGLVARENAGEHISDPSKKYTLQSHPLLGLNELMKLDGFKYDKHILPQTLTGMGRSDARIRVNGKMPAEKVAEMLKHRENSKDYNDHYERLAPLADLTPYGGKIPDWFPKNRAAHLDTVQHMTLDNPTYRIPKEALSTIGSGLPQWALIEQASPELKAEIAKMAQIVTKHNENYRKQFGGPPGSSYGNVAIKPSNAEFVADMDALAKENGLTDARKLLGTVYNDPNRLHKRLFSSIQDSHPEEAARLAESVGDGEKFFGHHLSETDAVVNSGNYDINPKVFGHIKDEELLRELDNEDILDHSAEGLSPEFLKKRQQNSREMFEHALQLMRDGVYIPHHGLAGQDTTVLTLAAKAGALDELYEKAGYFGDTAMVKRNSEPLRYLRDYLEQMQKEGKDPVIDPKELPKDKTFNSITSAVRSKNKDGSETESRALDWNPLRDPKKGGKVTLQSVQNYIDSMPETKFNISHTSWNGAQRHNGESSNVMVVGLTDEHIKKIKDAGLWPTFKKLSDSLPRSHPQHPMTLGWVRYTGAAGMEISKANKRIIEAQPDATIFTDELQSDLMKGVNRLKPEKAKKLNEILFGGTHPSELLYEAFHEMARKSGLTGKIVRVHSSESKAPISLDSKDKAVPVHFNRTYEDMPKKKLNAEPSTYGHPDFPSENHEGPSASRNTKTIQGKRIWQAVFRKSEEYSDWDDA